MKMSGFIELYQLRTRRSIYLQCNGKRVGRSAFIKVYLMVVLRQMSHIEYYFSKLIDEMSRFFL
jgi:hypothetical protein